MNNIRPIKEFITPSFPELSAIIGETFFITPPIAILAYHLSHQNEAALLVGFVPQTLTYLGARAYDLFGKNEYILDQLKGMKNYHLHDK